MQLDCFSWFLFHASLFHFLLSGQFGESIEDSLARSSWIVIASLEEVVEVDSWGVVIEREGFQNLEKA